LIPKVRPILRPSSDWPAELRFGSRAADPTTSRHLKSLSAAPHPRNAGGRLVHLRIVPRADLMAYNRENRRGPHHRGLESERSGAILLTSWMEGREFMSTDHSYGAVNF
jgi:hypothetical protein